MSERLTHLLLLLPFSRSHLLLFFSFFPSHHLSFHVCVSVSFLSLWESFQSPGRQRHIYQGIHSFALCFLPFFITDILLHLLLPLFLSTLQPPRPASECAGEAEWEWTIARVGVCFVNEEKPRRGREHRSVLSFFPHPRWNKPSVVPSEWTLARRRLGGEGSSSTGSSRLDEQERVEEPTRRTFSR